MTHLTLLPMLLLSPASQAQDVIQLHDSAGVSPASPDQYMVRPGDTLWEISRKFLGNPDNWPHLWAINDHVTNPHWIYPGNRIVFVPGTLIEPPSVGLGDPAPERDGYQSSTVKFTDADYQCGPDSAFSSRHEGVVLTAPGVMDDREKTEILGEVYKARVSGVLMGEGNVVYLRLKDPEALECGDVVSILNRSVRRVKHPSARRKYGSMYRVAGEARILHVLGDVATAVLRDTFSEVQRGDLVVPHVPVKVELDIDAPQGNLEGTVVARLFDQYSILGSTGETVFVDRGRADGVRVGNTFYVVEKRDDLLDTRKEDPDLPDAVIGRLVVVRVDENSSTAVVVDANRSVEAGARLTMLVE